MYKVCNIDLGRSEEIYKKIALYCKEVIKKCDPQKIILFGSSAGNDITEGSDIDLVVIADFQEGFLDRIKKLLDLNKINL